MIAVDSCIWIAWLTADPRGERLRAQLAQPHEILVPTVVLYEVVRWTQRERGQAAAVTIAAHLQQCEIAGLEPAVALLACDLSLRHRLAMADAMVYAHAQVAQVPLWTSHSYFSGLPGVVLG